MTIRSDPRTNTSAGPVAVTSRKRPDGRGCQDNRSSPVLWASTTASVLHKAARSRASHSTAGTAVANTRRAVPAGQAAAIAFGPKRRDQHRVEEMFRLRGTSSGSPPGRSNKKTKAHPGRQPSTNAEDFRTIVVLDRRASGRGLAEG